MSGRVSKFRAVFDVRKQIEEEKASPEPPAPNHAAAPLQDAAAIPTSIPTAIPEGIPTEANERPAQPPKRIRDVAETNLGEAEALPFTPLDATHTSSEKSIYSVIYRETISKGIKERHFGPAELQKKSGIRSRNTVHRALYGLIEKLSVEVVSKATGNPLGPRYRVYKPLEIERRRRAVGMQIDPQTKRIVGKTEPGPSIPTSIPTGIPETTPGGYPQNREGGIPETEGATIPNSGTLIKNKDNLGDESGATASSSSKSVAPDDDRDHEAAAIYIEQIKQAYERVTGNSWSTTDEMTALAAKHIPAAIWTIAICHCVDRAPGHTFNQLAYVVEEAGRYFETLKTWPQSDIEFMAKRGLRRMEKARLSGNWDPATAEL